MVEMNGLHYEMRQKNEARPGCTVSQLKNTFPRPDSII